MPKLFHARKSNLIFPLILLPVFLWVAYEEITHSNFLYAIVSIVAWFSVVLFVVNYWFQAVVIFIGAFVAFYFRHWWAGILLLLLSAYLVNAARIVERGELENLDQLREKLPTAGKIIDLLQDQKKMRILMIILVVFSLIISFITLQFIKSP